MVRKLVDVEGDWDMLTRQFYPRNSVVRDPVDATGYIGV